jgi:serine/threonine protein kinase
VNDSEPDEWVFAGRYRVDAPIGSGGMGAVWSGYDRQLDRRVAIKLMHQSVVPAVRTGSPEANALADALVADRERFLREIRTTARLELPGIPAVYDFGIEDSTGRIYLVMQLLGGQTLNELIAERDYTADPWPVSWAAAIAAQVSATLVDVHRVNVVHRDIKPSNLMVSSNGMVKIFDFGVAVLQGAGALPKLTQIGKTVGSPPYMPPEQVLGNPVGPASDVYALGCVLHEMLTGRVPFIGTRNRSYQDHHINTPAPSTRGARPEIPGDLDELLGAMLAKKPAERPEADAVYDALMPFIRSGPADLTDRLDPRRPFIRPLAPPPRSSETAAIVNRIPRASSTPLTADEALALDERAMQLIEEGQFQRAIDILDDAARRAVHDSDLELDRRIKLGTALYLADEFTRAAEVLDTVLPDIDIHDDAGVLRYYAGVSHGEAGRLDSAIEHLTAYLDGGDLDDELRRDAMYRLGVLLAAVGHADEGLQHLEMLRPALIAAYGPDSVHVSSLDRQIERIRNGA